MDRHDLLYIQDNAMNDNLSNLAQTGTLAGGLHAHDGLVLVGEYHIQLQSDSGGAALVPISQPVTQLQYTVATVPGFPASVNTSTPTGCELERATLVFERAREIKSLRDQREKLQKERPARLAKLAQLRKDNEFYKSRLRNIEQSFVEDRQAAAETRASLDSLQKRVDDHGQALRLMQDRVETMRKTDRDLMVRVRRLAQNRGENHARLERVARGIHVLRLNTRCLKNVLVPGIQRRPRATFLFDKHRRSHHRRCSIKAKNAARHRYPGWDSYRPYYGPAITSSQYNSFPHSYHGHDWSE
jgi:hypothetical protein